MRFKLVRYRKHCANRTHRLRSSLKLTHGKGREFKKLPVLTPENVKDGQYVIFKDLRHLYLIIVVFSSFSSNQSVHGHILKNSKLKP